MDDASRDFYKAPAPDGQIYVCAACGKTGRCRNELGDVSCMQWAVLCYEKRAENGNFIRVRDST